MAATIRQLRSQFYDDVIPTGRLRQYHLSEQEIAGVFGTETRHPPGFKIPRHAHDLASFYVVLEGGLTEILEHGRRDRETHSVVFTPPGKIHGNAFHEAGGRCFLVEFSRPWTERLAASSIRFEQTVAATDGELTRLATRLYREFRDTDNVSPLAVEGLALEILAGFSRQSAQAPDRCLPSWLRQARKLLHDRFAETLTLGEIAGLVGVHPVSLARTFRKRFRCSVGDYQRRLRVEHASRQLTTTRRPIVEIALAAGFADQAHFSRVFKEYTGLTPARFRSAFHLG